MSTELDRRLERMVEEFSSKRLCHVHGGRRSSTEENEDCLAARFEVAWEMFGSL